MVRRGDIVVFVRNENDASYNYIRRVIVLPGETVETSGETLKVDGRAALRQRIGETQGRTRFRERIGGVSCDIAIDRSSRNAFPEVSMTVPPGHFFVMGDDRLDARDSRHFGAVPFQSIVGKKVSLLGRKGSALPCRGRIRQTMTGLDMRVDATLAGADERAAAENRKPRNAASVR